MKHLILNYANKSYPLLARISLGGAEQDFVASSSMPAGQLSRYKNVHFLIAQENRQWVWWVGDLPLYLEVMFEALYAAARLFRNGTFPGKGPVLSSQEAANSRGECI